MFEFSVIFRKLRVFFKIGRYKERDCSQEYSACSVAAMPSHFTVSPV
jgi:hypothetical protein